MPSTTTMAAYHEADEGLGGHTGRTRHDPGQYSPIGEVPPSPDPAQVSHLQQPSVTHATPQYVPAEDEGEEVKLDDGAAGSYPPRSSRAGKRPKGHGRQASTGSAINKGGDSGGGGGGGRKVFTPRRRAAPSRWRKMGSSLTFDISKLWKKGPRPQYARSIMVNSPLPDGPEWRDKKGRVLRNKVYPTNQNVTSKYTIITFLPRNLFEQFRRIANVYFLAIAILQFFPKFSTISPGLVILPLLAVLAITALKDGYEDYKRHQSDFKVNHSITHVLGGGPGAAHHLFESSGGKQGKVADDGDGIYYRNYNEMTGKNKTFLPALPLDKLRRKKGKKGKKGKKDQEDDDVSEESSNGGQTPPQATKAMKEGVVENPERDWTRSAPSGASDPFADETVAAATAPSGPVNNPDDDPECFDDVHELGWKQTIWEDVKVGDFVKIYENEQLPADIVICATSEEEDVCYIETKNLDGETNLKSRHGVPELTHLRTAEACGRAHFQIDAEAADVNMFRLNGAAIFPDEQTPGGQPKIHPINLETTALRGCVVKNTAWVIGVVLFTGEDTKIILNSGGTPSKRSKVERQMNPQVLLNLLLLAVVSAVCAIIDHFNEVSWNEDQAYWELYANSSGDNPSINGLVTFANGLITFQNIVPISLYISIEFVRTAQAAFIYFDHAIKYVKNGVTTRTTARSWNLSDDLGQVEYVFSDKTGTLTQNSMVFRQCSIGGKVYSGDGEVPANTVVPEDKGSLDGPSSTSSDTPTKTHAAAAAGGGTEQQPKVKLAKEVLAPFHDNELSADLNVDSEQSRLLNGFFTCLALCHTALAAEPEPGVIEFKAQSPDEAALVQAAADVGYVFRGRDHQTLKMTTPFSNEIDEYELLNVLEFNSTRKRMSVIVRKHDESGRLFLLCKGADNVIFERLAKGNDEVRSKTDSDLQYFASEGLRTLCLGYRIISEEEYESWSEAYHDASVAMENREQKVEDVSASIEKELTLLGATAIEDRLQDGVPETIADLKRAGIKVWVATGDKLETAVAIGYTTNLLTRDTNLIIIREGRTSIYDQLKNALEGFFNEQVNDMPDGHRISMDADSRAHQLRRLDTGVTSLVGQDNGTKPGGFSLVIDGGALRTAFEEEDTEELLLHLSTQCNTVICCRVSPLQKAQIVRLIKDNLGVMCLAIGDGANDVSMIQAADIGVGISGEEGLQAVNSSDYAIAQFRYLKRLLFVHGHWSYVRNSNMILNFFYKNVINVGVLFWFQIYCGWSAAYVFEYTYLLFWNVFWTLLPVIALGLFERDTDADILMAIPELYWKGREGRYFGLKRFSIFILQGIYQSAIIYFFICYAYITTTARKDGYNVGQFEMSTVMAISAAMVANAFTGFNIHSWTGWVVFGILFGPVLIWIYTAIYSIIPPSSFATNAYGNDTYLFPAAYFWFGLIFTFILALLPRYLSRAWEELYRPTDVDIMNQVKRYRSDIDIVTDPTLGGRPKAIHQKEAAPGHQAVDSPAATPTAEKTEQLAARRERGLSGFGSSLRDRPSEMPSRMSILRRGRGNNNNSNKLGMSHSARGSQVDMSTGLAREQSRGFDFDIEERGVAISRMQSRLSEISRQRTSMDRSRASIDQPATNTTDSPSKQRFRSGSVHRAMNAMLPNRARSGSLLRPNKDKKDKGKGFFEQTPAMPGETGPRDGEPAPPQQQNVGSSHQTDGVVGGT